LMFMKTYLLPSLITVALLITAASTHAQTTRVFANGDSDNLWDNSLNWAGGDIADTTAELAQLNASVIVNDNFTINRIQNNFGVSIDYTVSSDGGTLTLNPGSNFGDAIRNVSNNGGNLQFSGSVAVNNTGTGSPDAISSFGFGNAPGKAITFSSTSTLNLSTRIETDTSASGSGNSINFNGAITGGAAGNAGIRIGANDTGVTFGATADNTGYAGDIVFFAGSEVVSATTVAGGFVRSGSKIQINGSGGSLTFDGSGAMGGNVVIGAGNSFTLNVNADQSSMGLLNLGAGSALFIVLEGAVSEFAFGSSAASDWGTGTVGIAGFKENTIRFGTDAGGLTAAQLGLIDGGIYTITDQGYLSVPEPSAFALIFGVCALGATASRRRRS
jgi:hypothetical protein